MAQSQSAPPPKFFFLSLSPKKLEDTVFFQRQKTEAPKVELNFLKKKKKKKTEFQKVAPLGLCHILDNQILRKNLGGPLRDSAILSTIGHLDKFRGTEHSVTPALGKIPKSLVAIFY